VRHLTETKLDKYASSDRNLEVSPRLCVAIVLHTYDKIKEEYRVRVRYAADAIDFRQYDWYFKEKYGGGTYDIKGYEF
jgi:hypothetical protein